jgi:TolB-like protein/Tfp pilus assembly protein PilF
MTETPHASSGSDSALPRGDRLDSWKAIAARLNRDISTVQRWEKREGLPVHRHLHDKRGSVYAYTSEVDAWWDGRRHSLDVRAPERGMEGTTPPGRFRATRAIVAIGIVVVLLVGAIFWGIDSLREPKAVESLAVLPFENLSGDSSQDYLADGITDALTTNLARIRTLHVISRTSARQYKSAAKRLPDIARELEVDAILEGAVSRNGDRVRVSAQLIDARSDRHIWADSYDRELREIPTLGSDVARAVAAQVGIRLTPQEDGRLTQAGRVNAEAYDLYLRGRYLWNQRTEVQLLKAIEYFQRAIEKDQSFAPAYAGLADTYGLFGFSLYAAMPAAEAEQRAEAAARRALQLDDTLAEAHAALGGIYHRSKWNWVEAQRELQRAIELNPGYAPGHQTYALYLATVGRQQDALAAIRRALQLDPASPIINAAVGRQFIFARQWDDAIEQLQKTIELQPTFMAAYHRLGQAYGAKEMYTEAITALEKARELSNNNPLVLAALGHTSARAGKRNRAQELAAEMTRLSSARRVSSYDMAVLYSGLEDYNQAFSWLERAYEQRDPSLVYLKVESWFEPIRSDPRFDALARRIGLP